MAPITRAFLLTHARQLPALHLSIPAGARLPPRPPPPSPRLHTPRLPPSPRLQARTCVVPSNGHWRRSHESETKRRASRWTRRSSRPRGTREQLSGLPSATKAPVCPVRQFSPLLVPATRRCVPNPLPIPLSTARSAVSLPSLLGRCSSRGTCTRWIAASCERRQNGA